MAYLLIAHNLATVRYLSHRVAVMYLGSIVESAPSEALFTHPLHPYTKALISAALPIRPGEEREEILLSGEVPSPTNPPAGCRFHSRCPLAFARCSEEAQSCASYAPGHLAAVMCMNDRCWERCSRVGGRVIVGTARLVGWYCLAIGQLPDVEHACQAGRFFDNLLARDHWDGWSSKSTQ